MPPLDQNGWKPFRIAKCALDQCPTAIFNCKLCFWTEVACIEFDGVPFSVWEKQILDCHHGEEYFKQKRHLVAKDVWLQGSRKMGCQYILYPVYEVSCSLRVQTEQQWNNWEQIYNLNHPSSTKYLSLLKRHIMLPISPMVHTWWPKESMQLGRENIRLLVREGTYDRILRNQKSL